MPTYDPLHGLMLHKHPVTDLTITGAPTGAKFLRDDGSWQEVSGASSELIDGGSPTDTATFNADGGTL